MNIFFPPLCKLGARAWVGMALLGLTGCQSVKDYSLTHRLWTSAEMRVFYEPAADPRLEFFYDRTQGDVLTVYDETHETRNGRRRRAYFANRNRIGVEAGRKPRFVNPERSRGLPAILAESAPASSSHASTLHVFVATNGQHFTFSGGFGDHDYQLPVYPDHAGVVSRVLFSPFAIAGDVVMVGVVAGVVVAYSYAQGGGCR